VTPADGTQRMRNYVSFDPALHPETHRKISVLGGKARVAGRSPARRREISRLAGLAGKGIKKNQGEKHGNHKLTEANVLEIRATPGAWACSAELAQGYGVTPGCIRHVLARTTWRHI